LVVGEEERQIAIGGNLLSDVLGISEQSRRKRIPLVLNIVFYLCIFIGSPAVAVFRDLLTWPYRYFGLGFVLRVLWTTIFTAGVPLVIAIIAAKGRGVQKRVFLVVWVIINGYVIYDAVRHSLEKFSLPVAAALSAHPSEIQTAGLFWGRCAHFS
jgi:hypothetical protein